MALLEIRDLQVDFRVHDQWVRAVDGVSLSVQPGETLCLVGESGCGKSVTALSITRLLATPPARYSGGEIRVEGRNVLTMSELELRALRGRKIGYVFQEPGTSLNPVTRIGNQIRESLKLHQPDLAHDEEIVRWLKLVGIPAPEVQMQSYPHQLSGGMQQRVMIAMALATKPKLLVADEPTTALDVTIQAQILELLTDLRRRVGMAILLITHNLGIVGDHADWVAVMYAGQVVEVAPAQELLRRPWHPYTRALMRSVPELGRSVERLTAIPGTVPGPGRWPQGCRFAPRCSLAQAECRARSPALLEVEAGRWVRCPYWKAV